MVNIRRQLARLLLWLVSVWLIELLLIAFVVLATAGYHPGLALRAALAAVGGAHRGGLPRGERSDRITLDIFFISSGGFALTALLITAAMIRAGRHRGVTRWTADRQRPGPEMASQAASLPAPRVAAGPTGDAIKEIRQTVTTRTPSWSGILAAFMFVCAALGFASLGTLVLVYLRHPVPPSYYWVGWVVAFSLAGGFGGGYPPGAAPAKRSGKIYYLLAYFKAAPVWLRGAVVVDGVLLAAMCVRAGYTAILRPGDFNGTMMSENYAVALSFMFFVDALAFAPRARSAGR